jgi:(p)ppGpp synthase/HD superfamily hydrolase
MDATAGPCLDGPTLDEAIKLATRAHTGQADKAGDEYIGHPLRVMRTVATSAAAAGVDPLHARMAAVLHDVVEDSDVTLADLRAAGYPAAVVAAVDALTHPEGEQTEAYLARVAADPIAVVVKRADMADNSDPARLARLPAETADRYALRYAGRRRLLDDLVAARERTGGGLAGGGLAGGGSAGGGSADAGQ